MKPQLSQAIHIQLKASPLLLGLLCFVSILACAILLLTPMQLSIKLSLLALVILTSVYFILRDALLRLPQSWRRLEISHLGELKLTNNAGQVVTPKLAKSSLIHGFVTILNVKRNWFTLGLPPVILFTNAENAEPLRRLRVWLSWWKHQAPVEADA